MEKKTIYIPSETPRRASENRNASSRRSDLQYMSFESSSSKRPQGSRPPQRPTGSRPPQQGSPRRPMTEAERRRRHALRKKRRRRKRILRALIRMAFLAVLVLLVIIFIHLVKKGPFGNPFDLSDEPELVEVTEFIGLKDWDGHGVTVTEYGNYGVWLQLKGMFTPSAGKAVSSLSLELHDAYETKMIPVDQLGEAEVEKAAEEPADEKESEETESSTEAAPKLPPTYPMQFTLDESGIVVFSTSENLNSGVALDLMAEGSYTALLYAKYTDGTGERFTLSDASGMQPVDYYTLTKNGKNHEVTLSFANDTASGQQYLAYEKKEAVLPPDVFDIVIDPGHGGKDTGASNDIVTEKEMTLMYAQGIAAKLTEKGYKVLITRDGSEGDDKDMAYSMYDPDGRVNITCASKAKFCLSIHFNSNAEVTKGGFEIYCSGKDNPALASQIADTVVANAGATYSNQKSYKVAEGVYVKTYTEEQIRDLDEKAVKNNFEPYGTITTETDYLFMIRETGGTFTGAYIDGRNPYYGENLYRNSNSVPESYLLEVAYLSVPSDFENAYQNADAYEQAIADALLSWIDNNFSNVII